MKKVVLLFILVVFSFGASAVNNCKESKQLIVDHNIIYPDTVSEKYKNQKKFPTVIFLHPSGGYKKYHKNMMDFLNEGFAIISVDYFSKYCIKTNNRYSTFSTYREKTEKDFQNLIEHIKENPRIDSKHLFSYGRSMGNVWSSYLAGSNLVNAGAGVYGVWRGKSSTSYPQKYFKEDSNPYLILIGKKDSITTWERHGKIAEKIIKKSKNVQLHLYENAGHNWGYDGDCYKHMKFCQDGYYPEVHTDSQKRIIVFFKKNLKEAK
tara:strand:+ start:159 stop:950 length:792 start_codon:yes stop_codon:yes gene_type:complete